MTFKEFDQLAEKRLFESIFTVIMQSRSVMPIKSKVKKIGEVIMLYAKAYEKQTGNRADINDVVEVLINHE